MTDMHDPLSPTRLRVFKTYADTSAELRVSHKKTEDELLQRIWNLAWDVRTLVAAVEAAASAPPSLQAPSNSRAYHEANAAGWRETALAAQHDLRMAESSLADHKQALAEHKKAVRDEITTALWLAALDRVPIGKRIEWVSALLDRYDEVRALQRKAPE